MKTIAIVDDDLHIQDMLRILLQREGYRVICAYSGTEARYLLRDEHPDLILLDLMLPGLSGEEVLAGIRKIPVIVLSAKADVEDKVSLLAEGASDYITKPFDTRELLARIAVQLRKNTSNFSPAIYRVGPLTLDTLSHSLTVESAEKPPALSGSQRQNTVFCAGAASAATIHLTKTEYAILKLLMKHPGQVISKSVILDRISTDTPDCTDSSLKQHVSNLRKKLRDACGMDFIESVWGIGFKLQDTPEKPVS